MPYFMTSYFVFSSRMERFYEHKLNINTVYTYHEGWMRS